jgi:predicted nucleic acid-binding protein
MTEPVCNSSPLIALQQIGQLRVLQLLFGGVLIPEAVRQEIAPSVALPEWLHIQALAFPIDRVIQEAALGRGETEAISLTLELGNRLLILDERVGRRLAQRLGLSVIGTLGVLLAAKQRGYIEELKPHLQALQRYDFRISRDLLRSVLQSANE